MKVDLHCHSCVSDGLLSPSEVVRRAAANGVELLALTDHDHLGGNVEAAGIADELGVQFVNGVEISVSWMDTTVHVVGLGVALDDAGLQAGLAYIRSGRDSRALRMGEALANIGIRGAYEGAMRFAQSSALVGRAHFARFLVEQGYCRDVGTVFQHYLIRGKPGFVDHPWATLAEAVGWITGAGGVAVLAHPGRYRISGAELIGLLSEFRRLGGRALEVVSGADDEELRRRMAHHAREFGFLASCASDFHGPEESLVDLGRMAGLPADLDPVWKCLGR